MTEYNMNVFSAAPGGGNPCLVVMDADDMSAEMMRARTEKYGMEAVFICRAEQEGMKWRLRYFAPAKELSSCGHATVAAVSVLVKTGALSGSDAVLQTEGGPLSVSWEEGAQGLLVKMNQGAPEFSPIVEDVKEVCRVLNISPEALGSLPVQAVSVSRPKLMVPMKDEKTLHALQPSFEEMWDLCDQLGVTGFYPFAPGENGEARTYHARQYPNRTGYPEDPATGVAAAALGGYLAAYTAEQKEGTFRITVLQGYAMGRPSRLAADADLKDGAVTGTAVLGGAEAE